MKKNQKLFNFSFKDWISVWIFFSLCFSFTLVNGKGLSVTQFEIQFFVKAKHVFQRYFNRIFYIIPYCGHHRDIICKKKSFNCRIKLLTSSYEHHFYICAVHNN